MHYYRHTDAAPRKVGNGAQMNGGANFGSGIGFVPDSSMSALNGMSGLGGLGGSDSLQKILPFAAIATGQAQQGKQIFKDLESGDIASLAQRGFAVATEVERQRAAQEIKDPEERRRFLERTGPQRPGKKQSGMLKWLLIIGGVGIGAAILWKLLGSKGPEA